VFEDETQDAREMAQNMAEFAKRSTIPPQKAMSIMHVHLLKAQKEILTGLQKLVEEQLTRAETAQSATNGSAAEKIIVQ
jgi:hypothetical protein